MLHWNIEKNVQWGWRWGGEHSVCVCVCVYARERKEYLQEMENPKTQELPDQTCIPCGIDKYMLSLLFYTSM